MVCDSFDVKRVLRRPIFAGVHKRFEADRVQERRVACRKISVRPSHEVTERTSIPPSARIAMTRPQRVRRAFGRWLLAARRMELRFVPSEPQRLFALTIIIGIVCGLAAVGFHFAILTFERLLIGRAQSASGQSWKVWTIISPTLGGVVTGLLLEHVFPGARGSGIPQVKLAYAERGQISLRESVGKFLLASMQIGSGASLGREGPTVQICAGIASGLGRLGQVSIKNRRRLIPVGAAAGIAAAFNAPLAAVTFTIEEVVGKLDQTVLSGVIVAAALAAIIERSILGAHPVFDVDRPFALDDARSIILYAAMGVVAALASVAFTESLLGLRRHFRTQRLVPRWAQPAIGGLVTGVLAVVALTYMRVGGVTGGGYDVLREGLSGRLTVRIMLVIGLLKFVATVFSYSSGGSGGIFAPSLFLGAMLGGAFGSLDRTLFGHSDDGGSAFALVGMGAMFSATIRAPMTSVLIIIEMTSGYGLILPLMIANMTAYALARRLRPVAIYEALLEQDGVVLPAPHSPLGDLRVESLFSGAPRTIVTFALDTPRLEMQRLASSSMQRIFPVIDEEGKWFGGVLRSQLEVASEGLVTAKELACPIRAARFDDDLRLAADLLTEEGTEEIPVLDSSGRVLGLIDEATVAKGFLRAQLTPP